MSTRSPICNCCRSERICLCWSKYPLLLFQLRSSSVAAWLTLSVSWRILATSRSSLIWTSPSQSTTLQDVGEKSIGSKQSRPYTSSNAEYPVDRRTEILSAHIASGRYCTHFSGSLLQYLERELTNRIVATFYKAVGLGMIR